MKATKVFSTYEEARAFANMHPGAEVFYEDAETWIVEYLA